MFEFQNLGIYRNSITYNQAISKLLAEKLPEGILRSQLRKESIEVLLSISSAASCHNSEEKISFLKKGKMHCFNCIALLDYIREKEIIDDFIYLDHANKLEEISSSFSQLIKKLG